MFAAFSLRSACGAPSRLRHQRASTGAQHGGGAPAQVREDTMRRMLRHLRVGQALVGGAALVMAATTIGAAAGQPARRTVWDGVYSNAQAERATATFESVCSRCH